MLNQYHFKLYKYNLTTIFILSNIYYSESTTETRQTMTYPDALSNIRIRDSYYLPIITMLGMLLLTTIMSRCCQYIRVIVANKQGNKNNKNIPIRYVVSDVYECNIDDNNQC